MDSSLTDIIKLFDGYSRVARLYPAVLTLLPAVLTAALTIDADLGSRVLASVIAASAVATLLANVARSRGKALEVELLLQWGGWPSTQLLRHRDGSLERPTKLRYHSRLERLCQGLQIPTEVQERQDARAADEAYQSATRQLIELRRDEKYKLLHKENAHYGFRRNLLGLKPVALWLICGGLTWTVCDIVMGLPVMQTWRELRVDAATRTPLYVAAAVNIGSGIMWLALVRCEFVRQAGFEYAFALLRTLDGENP
jgi:hypothetical protein